MSDHPDIEKLPLETYSIPVRETIREIFRNPDNGAPDNISKAGCLALALRSNEVGGAARGSVVWNAWRSVFPVTGRPGNYCNVTDFENVDFRIEAINFSKFMFGDGARFQAAQWGNGASFTAAHWGNLANFQGAQWDIGAKFELARWGILADFRGAQWVGGAEFCGTLWGDGANFQGAQWASLRRVFLTEEKWEIAKQWANDQGASPDSFGFMDFSGAEFQGKVDFSNRKFTATTRFVEGDLDKRPHCIFGSVPLFHGSELHQDTSFEGAVFPQATGSDGAVSAYHTLKLAFSKQQAVRKEQLFFRLEMVEERIGHWNKAKQAWRRFKLLAGFREGLTWILYKAYSLLSDYGFSVARPLLLLVATWFLFASIYGSYSSGETVCVVWQPGCVLQETWLSYSLQQALPLTGFDKLKYAIERVPIGWLFIHKTLSLAALFLIGLALRNLFKLK
jgi:hypothetical protein